MRLYSTKEAARYLGVSPDWLKSQRRTGAPQTENTVPYLRLNRKLVRYDIQDLDEWLERRKASAHE